MYIRFEFRGGGGAFSAAFWRMYSEIQCIVSHSRRGGVGRGELRIGEGDGKSSIYVCALRCWVSPPYFGGVNEAESVNSIEDWKMDATRMGECTQTEVGGAHVRTCHGSAFPTSIGHFL
jgi:hypothetical protein